MENEQLIWSEKPSSKPGCIILSVTVPLANGSVYSDERVIEKDENDTFSNVIRGYMQQMALHELRKSRRNLAASTVDSPATFHAAPEPMSDEELIAVKSLPV